MTGILESHTLTVFLTESETNIVRTYYVWDLPDTEGIRPNLLPLSLRLMGERESEQVLSDI